MGPKLLVSWFGELVVGNWSVEITCDGLTELGCVLLVSGVFGLMWSLFSGTSIISTSLLLSESCISMTSSLVLQSICSGLSCLVCRDSSCEFCGVDLVGFLFCWRYSIFLLLIYMCV